MFSLIVLAKQVFCYQRESSQWQLRTLDGEDAFRLKRGSVSLLKELTDILHDAASIKACDIQVLFSHDDAAKQFAAELFTEATKKGFRQVQLIALEPLVSCAEQMGDKALGGAADQPTWCTAYLLPLLDSSLLELGVLMQEKQRLENAQGEWSLQAQLAGAQHSVALERASEAAHSAAEEVHNLQQVVQQQKQLLIELSTNTVAIQGQLDTQAKEHQRELAQLHARLANASAQPTEEIIRFMPVFFRNFWEKIRPDEMAQLLGMREAPTIAVPFPEPNPSTVATLRQQFNRLPESTKQIILSWVRDLSHDWDIRQEMLYLLETK